MQHTKRQKATHTQHATPQHTTDCTQTHRQQANKHNFDKTFALSRKFYTPQSLWKEKPKQEREPVLQASNN